MGGATLFPPSDTFHRFLQPPRQHWANAAVHAGRSQPPHVVRRKEAFSFTQRSLNQNFVYSIYCKSDIFLARS